MDETILTTQLTSSVIVVWVLQYLKAFLGLQGRAAVVVVRFGSVMLAVLTAAGIHYTFDSEAGILTITGITLANVAHFLWGAFQQFVGQEIVYEAVYNKPKEP